MIRHLPARRLSRCLAVTLASLTLMAGCGSGSDSDSSEAGTSSQSSGETGDSSSGELVKVTLAGSTGGGILPAVVANEQGFFEKHGLDVEITFATNPSNLTAGLGHQFQIIQSYQATLINAVSQGIPAVAVAGGEIDEPDNELTTLVVPVDSDIKRFADIAGKRIGTPTTNGAIAVCNLAAVKADGGDPSKVEMVEVPFSSHVAQAEAGRIDGFFSATPYHAALDETKFRKIGDCFRSIEPNLFTIFISSQPWADENRETLEKFRAALDDADQWLQDNRDGAIATFSKMSGLAADLISAAPVPKYKSDVEPEDVLPWIQMMRDVGVFDGEIKDEDALVLSDD